MIFGLRSGSVVKMLMQHVQGLGLIPTTEKSKKGQTDQEWDKACSSL